jgi:hypothetical protein
MIRDGPLNTTVALIQPTMIGPVAVPVDQVQSRAER